MCYKVLWVEDDARGGLARLAGPVYVRGYDLEIAHDASTAFELISQKIFDVLIIDIRIPAGSDPRWQNCFQNGGGDKIRARLGLHLLESFLGDPQAVVPMQNRPTWITKERIMLFTVELFTEIEASVKKLSLTQDHFRQKGANMSDGILLELIEAVIRRNNE